jgi:hypothetical protein
MGEPVANTWLIPINAPYLRDSILLTVGIELINTTDMTKFSLEDKAKYLTPSNDFERGGAAKIHKMPAEFPVPLYE